MSEQVSFRNAEFSGVAPPVRNRPCARPGCGHGESDYHILSDNGRRMSCGVAPRNPYTGKQLRCRCNQFIPPPGGDR